MTCAQNRPLPKFADAVSETCEAAMWKFKFDLTRDVEHGMANRIQKVLVNIEGYRFSMGLKIYYILNNNISTIFVFFLALSP